MLSSNLRKAYEFCSVKPVKLGTYCSSCF